MMTGIENILLTWGVPASFSLATSVLVLFLSVVIVAIISDWIARQVLLRVLGKVIAKTANRWDDTALENKVFHRLSHLASAVVFYLAAPLFILTEWEFSYNVVEFVRRGSMLYMLLITALVIDSFLTSIVHIYRHYEVANQKPIKSYVQVLKIILILVVVVLMLATMLDKSPWAFFTGLGAMTAVLLLIFKDSILGFVASIQNASYDMIRIGDWVEMSKYGVDGEVLDISLNTIKVQNWDKTVSTIPTASLLSESVKNWRGMSQSGGRRIKRHLNIDMNSVQFCTPDLLERLGKIQLLQEYLQNKKNEIQTYNQEHEVQKSSLANGRHLTNLGIFRAYIEAYLKQHPKIHQQGMTFLVRQLQPTSEGIPLELYVFSNDTRWVSYEGIQGDIFDHLLAVLPEFGLVVFQKVSGRDFRPGAGALNS